MQGKVQPMQTPSTSHMGKVIAKYTSKYRSEITIYEGAIRITYWHAHCGYPWLGWTIRHEIIPKQSIVGVEVNGMCHYKCCCCCPVFNCSVKFQILKKSNIVPEKKSFWKSICGGGNGEDPNETPVGQYQPDFDEDEDDMFAQMGFLKNQKVEHTREYKTFVFAWDETNLKDYATVLHNYVYGSVAAGGTLHDAQNLSHLLAQGICKESKGHIALSKV